MTLELNEIIQSLKELWNFIIVKHNWKTIAVIDEKTEIKDFVILKNHEENEIVLKFNPNNDDF